MLQMVAFTRMCFLHDHLGIVQHEAAEDDQAAVNYQREGIERWPNHGQQ